MATPWVFGFMTSIKGSSGLVRMGLYNGDTTWGPIVDPIDIETKPY